MAVIDELIVRKGTTRYPIDSYDNKMIDEIVVEGQSFHFAKQKDLTGTSEIVADNGVAEPIISLGVSGNTAQKTFEGYNLYDISKVTGARPSPTTTPDVAGSAQYGTITDGVMHLRWATYANRTIWTGAKIPIKQGGKYYLSAEFLVGSDIVTTNVKALYSLFNYTKNTGTGWTSVSFPNERDTWVSKTLMISSVSDDWIGDDVYLSLQSGGSAEQYSNIPMYAKNVIISYEQARTYEPYVGGIPSPNPQYPQEIENANKEGMSVVLHGDNFREEIAIPPSVEVDGETVDLRFAKYKNADYLLMEKGKVKYFAYSTEGDPTKTLSQQLENIPPIEYDLTNTELGQSLLALATGKGTNYLEITSDLAPSQTDLSYWRQIIPNE